MTIRAATADDLPALLDLYDQLIPGDARCPPDLAVALLDRLVLYPGSAILLRMSGDLPAASCTLIVIPNLTRGGMPYGLIENVVTHADHRRQGHGQALLAAARAMAWHANCYKVMLLTGSTAPATHRFYTSAGFEQSKTGYQARRLPARPETATD